MYLQRRANKGGRPTKGESSDKSLLRKKAVAMIEAKTRELVSGYLRFAMVDPATSRHAIDKLFPEGLEQSTPEKISIEIKLRPAVVEPSPESAKVIEVSE